MQNTVEVVSKAFGFVGWRQMDPGIWRLGWYRYRVMYYTEEPSLLRDYLTSDRLAVFVYDGSKQLDLPANLAQRGRSVMQLLIPKDDGTYEPDVAMLDQLVPRRTAGLVGRRHAGGGLNQRIYAWSLMMCGWYERLKSGQERRLRQPPIKWVAEFFGSSSAPRQVRLAGVSVRTLKRDLAELLHPQPGSAAELLSGEFIYLWTQCTNLHFVMNESEIRLRTLVERMLKLYPTDRPEPVLPEVGGKRLYQPL